MKYKQTFEELYPEFVKEWNFNKNNIKPNQISPKSKKKIWWICKKGHEWETALINRTHSKSGCHICSGYSKQNKCKYSKDRKQKQCNNCNEFKDISCFRIRKQKEGKFLESICKLCSNNKVDKYRTMTNDGIVAEIVRRKKSECKKNNLPFDLDKDWISKRLNEIDWKCELTGLPMRTIKLDEKEKYQGFQLDSLSVDRINHQGGYTKDNIRFVLNQINIFRSNGDDERMYMLAEMLIKYKELK